MENLKLITVMSELSLDAERALHINSINNLGIMDGIENPQTSCQVDVSPNNSIAVRSLRPCSEYGWPQTGDQVNLFYSDGLGNERLMKPSEICDVIKTPDKANCLIHGVETDDRTTLQLTGADLSLGQAVIVGMTDDPTYPYDLRFDELVAAKDPWDINLANQVAEALPTVELIGGIIGLLGCGLFLRWLNSIPDEFNIRDARKKAEKEETEWKYSRMLGDIDEYANAEVGILRTGEGFISADTGASNSIQINRGKGGYMDPNSGMSSSLNNPNFDEDGYPEY